MRKRDTEAVMKFRNRVFGSPESRRLEGRGLRKNITRSAKNPGAKSLLPLWAFLLPVLVLPIIPGVCGPVSVAASESWGAKMFPVKRHNFGRVALQANEEYAFEIENLWKNDVRLVGVYSSCTCTQVSATKMKLASLEKGTVVAKLNTTGQHTKNVGATITIVLEMKERDVERGFDRILHDEVQLEIKAYVRPDVVLTPGIVEFGSVPEGKSVSRRVRLEYAGKNDWQLTRIVRSNPYVHARAEEVRRTGGEVVYDIVVTLNRRQDAPEGYIKDVIRFVTNETPVGQKEPTALTLPVQGAVVAPLQAKPAPFLIGVLRSGDRVIKNLIVHNDTPFRVRSVTSPDKRFRFTFPEQESPVHMISVLFAVPADATAEHINQRIFVRTSLDEDDPIIVDVQGRLLGAGARESGTGGESGVVGNAETATSSTVDLPLVIPVSGNSAWVPDEEIGGENAPDGRPGEATTGAWVPRTPETVPESTPHDETAPTW